MEASAAMAAEPLRDCWNRIGVQGDGSCPALAAHVHCRNCPVYAAGAAALLERDLPAAYRAEWTRHFAIGKQALEQGSRSVFVFRLGREWLALPTAVLEEVAAARVVHSLPHRRTGEVLGLVNVRGELLVTVSLAAVLGTEVADREARGAADRRLLVVVQRNGGRLAFPVDEVQGVHRFQPSELGDVPATVAQASTAYATAVLSWSGRSIGCLDAQRLFEALDRSLA